MLQVKPQALPLHVAVLLAGIGQAVHDVVPHVAGLEFIAHWPLQMC